MITTSRSITVNGRPLIVCDGRTDMTIFGMTARGVQINRSGTIFSGFLCADDDNPEALTARFTRTGDVGGTDAYTISPESDYPGRTVTVPDLAEAVTRAHEWVYPPAEEGPTP